MLQSGKHVMGCQKRWWQGRLVGALAFMVLLTISQPAAAYWGEEIVDYVEDGMKGVLNLTWDIITLDPEDAWKDFKDIAYNEVCFRLTPLSLAISSGLEVDFDECADPPQPIEPEILKKLRLYFKSPLDSVRIHKRCRLDADLIPGNDADKRVAITFGEHIYFKRGAYHPQDPKGFALLAHELVHVLQYRKKGFADFTCEYGLNCLFGANRSCAIEEEADRFEDLVFTDQERTGYMVEVHTCAKKDSGTDSLIEMKLQIRDPSGKSHTLGPWEQDKGRYDDHERDQWDRYLFPESTLAAHIEYLVLLSDGGGDKPGWCWDRHYVTRIENGKSIWTWAWEKESPWLSDGWHAFPFTYGDRGRPIPDDLRINDLYPK
jgi:hypothetical protein